MILVIGGTSEGRIAADTLDEGEGSYFYSTVGPEQEVTCARGVRILGGMDAEEMTGFCTREGIRMIVDAAHPYATGVHRNVEQTAMSLGLPVVRIERPREDLGGEDVVVCEDYADAVRKMKADGVRRLLALSGVGTIGKLSGFWREGEAWFRILDRDDSRRKAAEQGFPLSRIVYYPRDDMESLMERICPDAVVTKESGPTGGFGEKLRIARAHGVRVYVVSRPEMARSFIRVEGRHGLRREIERLVPDYYPLHTGFTTGSCATAAARAALMGLLGMDVGPEVDFRIPEGETMHMPVSRIVVGRESAAATVVKDAGDDPDVTDGSEISVKVAYSPRPGITFIGGEGIGTVTLPGLGLEVGEPAINPVPRKMIESELEVLYSGGLDVTVSVKGGDGLALKTFNPRVGVVGGISIVGTTGIVRPLSHEAFIRSMERQMNVAVACGCEVLVLNSGGSSEKVMRREYPYFPSCSFIHYGNAVGQCLGIAERMGVPRLVLGVMIGKAVKLAEGNMDTHSHVVEMNVGFLQALARECGCGEETLSAIGGLGLARELWGLLDENESGMFFQTLLARCHACCKSIYHGSLEIVLMNDKGKVKYRRS